MHSAAARSPDTKAFSDLVCDWLKRTPYSWVRIMVIGSGVSQARYVGYGS